MWKNLLTVVFFYGVAAYGNDQLGAEKMFSLKGRDEFFCSSSLVSPLPVSAVEELGSESVYYATGIDYPACNGILEQSLNREISDQEIERAIDFFGSRHLPFIWWTGSKDLVSKGFHFGGFLRGVNLDISGDIPPIESYVTVKKVETAEELTVFSQIGALTSGMSPACVEQLGAVSTSAMEKGQQIHFLAYSDETPVGCVTLSTCLATAGIWNLSTLPEFRKSGVGAALIHAAILKAKEMQYATVMAIVSPDGMARGLFTKMGFKDELQFPFYIYMGAFL